MASTTGGGGGSAMDAQLVALLDKLEGLRQEVGPPPRLSMIAEVRTLELWRAVIAECLATVFYVFLVCGAYSPWTGKVLTQDGQLTVALVAGFTMAILVHSFGQVSGGHINPAVTVSLAVTRHVSPLRAAMFVLAQLGGGIAGAALLYGATSSGYTGDLGATSVSQVITQWQGLGLEFLLTFVVVFVFFSSVNPYRRSFGNPSVVIGFAYMACTLVGLPLTGASMNPARSLGPAFVKNKWDAHWVYWVAPLVGGMTGGLIYEYIFNPHRVPRSRKDSMDGEQGVESFPLQTVGGPVMHGGQGQYQPSSLPPLQYQLQTEPQYDSRLYQAYPSNSLA
ncbi:neurogenic protein big brain-like isoform X3 [Portunus trituberculatus]|uniref:neurogenic protein big brain-like isoform X3 n=1 Tax=Portunus trituberculatus TaxID=210409 RepID=UPI001E1CE721|nr:neurogenic protein big brain-like isoform X3 [Portunus trituberculatus]